MERWDIVLVLTALIGLLSAVVTPLVKLTKAITRLTATMENMERNIVDLTTNNRAGHDRIWTHEREQDRLIADHECRIRVIEDDR
jgi:hypothetical protein